METRPARVHWAVALAALVGGVTGSFIASSMDSLGISTEGSLPLLGGGAAIYTASLVGALLGATVGSVIAFTIARNGSHRIAAISGSVAGTVSGAVVGYFSEGLAQAWINAFSGNPLEGALVGGAIAGGFAGTAGAASLRTFRSLGARTGRERGFTALLGGLLGLLGGIGGASIGASLAQSVLACPNGYSANPYTPSGCASGILQGSLLLGLWAGAITGAVGAVLTAYALSVLGRGGAARNPVA